MSIGLMRLLHTLKGEAGTLGATALSIAAANFEAKLAISSAPGGFAATAREAGAAIVADIPGLAAMMQALQAAAAPTVAAASPLDTAAAVTMLREIMELLRNSDMAATSVLARLTQEFGGALAARLQPVEDAIGMLDFQSSLILCEKLVTDLNVGQAAGPAASASIPA